MRKLFSKKLGVCVSVIALATVAPIAAMAQDNAYSIANYWPSATYDENVPTIKQVLGYDHGEKITSVENIEKYLLALKNYAPKRVYIADYGKTWQGRKLIYAIIGTEEQIANLESLKANSNALADPRKTPELRAKSIIENQPVIVWYTNSVHGDEISGADSSLRLAYHLLAAKDAQMDEIRKNVLVAIVPSQNPDGRERFLASNSQATGANPDADEFAAERDQPWPGGRMNHYHFDLNRDWFALTQPETQGQTKTFLEYYPQVVVDAHEMSRDGNFFFPPEADPINPTHTKEQRELRAIFGANNGKWFDKFGIQYFTREVFDGFYPGYGDSWPTSQGAIAMTYEQGSSRGMVARGKDGALLTYQDTVRNHFVAALSTIEAASNNRKRILNSFYEFRRSGIENGAGGAKSYIIPNQTNFSGAQKLAAVLSRQGIEVKRANASFSACGVNYTAGSYVVPTNQPASRLIMNLLEKNIPLDDAFSKRQLALRERGLNDEIYDVTAWSLPLLYNVDVKSCGTNPNVGGEIASKDFIIAQEIEKPNAQLGYVVKSANNGFNRFTALGLNQNLKMRAIEEEFIVEGKTYPAGSIVVLKSENAGMIDDKINEIAKQSGAQITGIDSSWVTFGPSFGSLKSIRLKQPKIAIAWDFPTSPYSAGNARFVIERKIGLNVTPLRVSRLKMPNLSRFDVLILPDTKGDYLSYIGEGGAANLRNFVQNGGVIISLGGATRFLVNEKVGLLDSKLETIKINPKDKPLEIKDEKDLLSVITPAESEPVEIDGAILKAKLGEAHWLTQGLPKEVFVMYQGNDVYTPLTRAQGENPIFFAAKNEIVASGLVWEQSKALMAYKPFAMVAPRGRGFVIGFSADPTYRAHTDGLDELLLNAIVQSTARANPAR